MSTGPEQRNTLYYGDNLDVLRRHIDSESVDLIYLDPPFNSNADYNVLFAEHDKTESAAQIRAFEDTWKWDAAAAEAFHDAIRSGHGKVPAAMQAFQTFLGESDMLAYLSMMAPRLIELHRVLKPTGSIYLHCDPTASHYLKMLMDAVFGAVHYRNEIIWRRTPFSGSSKARARQLPRSHDVLLFYSRGSQWVWEAPSAPYSEEYLKRFKWDDGDGRGAYRKTLLKTYSQETYDRLKADNRLIEPIRPGAKPSYKQYLNESSGIRQHDDVWTDVNAINPVAQERLGYPTQKPEALLERIVKASSNEGDLVLDPFCGCGTAIAVAEKLHRRWIGIDVTHLAVGLIKHRLRDSFDLHAGEDYDVVGEPTDLAGARKLAEENPFQFQAWALGLVGARVASSSKKGADKGIDGKLFFHDEGSAKADVKQVVISVKSGNVSVKDVRDLRGVLDREAKRGAKIGVLLTLNEPTRPMSAEAASAGHYDSPWGTSHARLQILTVEELLDGRDIGMPPSRDLRTFKKAPKSKRRKKDPELFQ